jgi:hypothetical protein
MSWFGEDDKVRKADWPVYDYMFEYFPLAYLEEVKVAVVGNRQHNPGQKLHWAREKSTDQLNTAMRHIFDYAKAKKDGQVCPRDSTGKAVLAQSIWRLKAALQLDAEQERAKAPATEPEDDDPIESSIEAGPCACGKLYLTYALEDNTFVYPDGSIHTGRGCRQQDKGPATGLRDPSQPVPADVELVHCACGARLFHLRPNELPPEVINPDGTSHSTVRCFTKERRHV